MSPLEQKELLKDIDEHLQMSEDPKHSGDSYENIEALASRSSTLVAQCKEVLDDHVITCCSDYLFKSHGVEAAIAAKDRAVHAEVDARQGLGIRQILRKVKRSVSIFNIFRVFEDVALSNIETHHDL